MTWTWVEKLDDWLYYQFHNQSENPKEPPKRSPEEKRDQLLAAYSPPPKESLNSFPQAETLTVPGPILAYRCWKLASEGKIGGISRWGNWTPIKEVVARDEGWGYEYGYGLTRPPKTHSVLTNDSCGIYALKSPVEVYKTMMDQICGGVWLWGDVVEHEHGYRAQKGYPAFFVITEEQARGAIPPECDPLARDKHSNFISWIPTPTFYKSLAETYNVPLFSVSSWDEFLPKEGMKERLLFPVELDE